MANNEQMTVSDVIRFLMEHAYKWRVREKFHTRQEEHDIAKTYADMEYAARFLALEIENEMRERALHYEDKKEV